MSEIVADEIVEEEYRRDDLDDGGEEDITDEELDIVRQESSFSKLSADSWLKVESEYDGDDDGADEDLREGDLGEMGEEYFWTDIGLRLREKSPADRSVLECLVELLSGVSALKKQRFTRFGDKKVWFTPDLRTVRWTSKKKGNDHGRVALASIRSVKSRRTTALEGERHCIIIETAEKKKIEWSLPNSQDSLLLVRCLACFSSLQAKVSSDNSNYNPRECEDYDLSLDTWNKKQLSRLVQLNNFYILDLPEIPLSRAKLVLSRSNKHFYGMKCLKSSIYSTVQREELAVLKKLKHPNVLSFKEFLRCKDRDGIYAIFEYIPRGLAMAGYKLDKNKPVHEALARKLIFDVASGLYYLHSKRIAHGDIRPDNLVMTTDGAVLINPLGCIIYDHTSRRKSLTSSATNNSAAAYAFAAPERCRDSERAPKPMSDDYSSDTWSLGALLYFMVYGQAPFLAENGQEMQKMITTSKLTFPEEPKVTKRLRDLMKRIIGEKDPRKRIKLEQVMKHPWLAESSSFHGGISLNPLKLFGKAEMEQKKVLITSSDIEKALSSANYVDPSTGSN